MNADVLGLIASAIFLVRLLPQPIWLARSGVAAGVSPLAGLNGTISALAWLAHGLEADLPIVWVVSAIALVPGLWTNALLARRTTRTDVLWSSVWLGSLVVAWFAGAFALALGGGVLVSQGPQLVRALRESDLSGLTPATWWISILDAASWGAYGWAVRDAAILGYFAVLTTCAVVVLVRIRVTRTDATETGPGTVEEFA